MASSFTTNKTLEKPGNGDYVDTWNVPVNSDLDVIDQAFGGTTSINVTAVSGTIALSASQYRSLILSFSGTLTANVNYQIPSGVGGQWVVSNTATGAFTVTVSSGGGGSSVIVESGKTRLAYSNGTSIKFSDEQQPIPSGTVMIFAQTSAPTGWTKIVAHNNKALRVVSGAASSGGSVDFTTAFSSQAVTGTVGNTTLTSAQIPAHQHFVAVNTVDYFTALTASNTVAKSGSDPNGYQNYTLTGNSGSANIGLSSSTGGGGSHTHTFTGTAIDLSVAYVDVILASKD